MPANPQAPVSSDPIPLPRVLGEAAKTYDEAIPPGAYHRLRLATYEGRVESTRIGGRIFVPRSALPAVAAELGMIRTAS
jgi:hypothetical protein